MTAAGNAAAPHDVCILGGGLAGLTLALQLRQRMPDLRVQVLERRAGEAPQATHKVGESTVEIGAHYLAHVLGLRDHLDTQHLRKFGFRFFFNDGANDLSACPELGPSQHLAVPTYQIDRGRLENQLAERARAHGVALLSGATATACDLDASGAVHRVSWRDDEGGQRLTPARWVIDATGRAGLLKRRLQLARGNGHAAFSVWFRIGRHLQPDRWAGAGGGTPDPEWFTRCGVDRRWLSTNHLCGPGYWVWLIPLASGCHSIGIVADPAFHDFEALKTYDGALAWLARHQPQLHAELQQPGSAPLDFAFLRSFSHDARQVFSEQRWALAGEAGRFLDPFYSPGSDFIAIGNGYITRLVETDRAGGDLRRAARLYELLFRSFYDNMLPIYQGQYALFGSPWAMSQKVVWDYTYYWSVLAPLFFHDRLHDERLLADAAADLQACALLNQGMQRWLRAAADAHGAVMPRAPGFHDHTRIDWFRRLNARLTQPADGHDVRRQMAEAPRAMAALARDILGRVGTSASAGESDERDRLTALCDRALARRVEKVQ